MRVNGRLNYAFAPRALPTRVSRLISYLYIPSGRELVSMIKKVLSEKWKFRAEYLTLGESELYRGNAKGYERGRNRERKQRKKQKSRSNIVHGVSSGG